MGFPRTTPWAGSSPCSTASSSSSASLVGSRPSIKSRRLRSLPWTARPAAPLWIGPKGEIRCTWSALGLGQPRGPGGGHGGREIQRDHGHPQTASDAGTTRGHRDHRCDGLPEGDRRHDTGTQGGLCAGGQRQSRTPGGRRRGVFCRPGRREPTDPANGVGQCASPKDMAGWRRAGTTRRPCRRRCGIGRSGRTCSRSVVLRGRGRNGAKKSRRSATSSAACPWTPRPWEKPSWATGGLRTGCTGCWICPSTRIAAAPDGGSAGEPGGAAALDRNLAPPRQDAQGRHRQEAPPGGLE